MMRIFPAFGSTLAIVSISALSHVASANGGATAPSVHQEALSPPKVAILLFDGVDPIDYVGPMEVFEYSHDIGDVYTVAATKSPITDAAGIVITPRYSFSDAPAPDILVIPGGNVGDAQQKDLALLAWIKKESATTRYTMSVCNGAFILASTGLLDGLKATTTAYWIPDFRDTFPKVTVVRDQRVVDNGKIVTTGGLTAGIDGALHVLSKMFGEAHAQQDALVLEYNWHPEFAPAELAYHAVPASMSMSDDLDRLGTWNLISSKGTKDKWEVTKLLTSNLSTVDLTGALTKLYVKNGDAPADGRLTKTKDLWTDSWLFHDRDGRGWYGTLSVSAAPNAVHQYLVGLRITRRN